MTKVMIFVLLTLTFGLIGCAEQASVGQSSQASPTDRVTQFEKDLHSHTKVLASDEFGGRAPATEGEVKTINYLKREFNRLGLEPGNGNSYFQTVPVLEMTTSPSASLRLKGHRYSRELKYGSDMVVFTQQQQKTISVADSELVFVGYGIYAPERNWNDYAGIDVTGKTVVILVNDPGFITQDPQHFTGNAMTYYGRWTYKFEEAARQGAAAALIVHDTLPASYPWAVVENSWSGPQIHLQSQGKNDSKKLNVEGWINKEQAQSLLTAAGYDYEKLKHRAARPGFKALPLDINLSTTLHNTIRLTESKNVLAKITGSEVPDEFVVYMAHWDHLGVDDSLEGDQIYNGAVDNATGTAALLALAREFTRYSPRRSILFMAVTAEESGLLGSKFYAENPIYPLNKTVGAINMDALGSIGPVYDVQVVGYGFNELQHYLEKHVKAQGRYIVADQHAEKGYYYRSDHFSLAKFGVPALYADGGVDSIAHGKEWGKAQLQAYTAERYHKPADNYHEGLDLGGAALDIDLYFSVGLDLANSNDWPGWSEKSEFRLIREKSLSEK